LTPSRLWRVETYFSQLRWAVRVVDLEDTPVAYAATFTEVEPVARDLITAVAGVEPEAVGVSVSHVPRSAGW